MLQVFDNPAQAVAVGHHKQLVVMFQRRENHIVPIGQNPFDRIFQRFGSRQFGGRYVTIADVEARIARIVLTQRRRRDIVAGGAR